MGFSNVYKIGIHFQRYKFKKEPIVTYNVQTLYC